MKQGTMFSSRRSADYIKRLTPDVRDDYIKKRIADHEIDRLIPFIKITNHDKHFREIEYEINIPTESTKEGTQMNVKIKRLHPDAVIPKYAHEGDAGFDLVAVEDVIIEPGETVKVPTGIAVELPPGYELQVRPRSGITLRTKLRVQLGTVDSNYRGEIGVIVDNTIRYKDAVGVPVDHYLDISDNAVSAFEYFGAWDSFKNGTYLIRKGDRIAQAVIAPVETANFVEVEELSNSERGEGGFGSSGY